jgi:hypothetical protein
LLHSQGQAIKREHFAEAVSDVLQVHGTGHGSCPFLQGWPACGCLMNNCVDYTMPGIAKTPKKTSQKLSRKSSQKMSRNRRASAPMQKSEAVKRGIGIATKSPRNGPRFGSEDSQKRNAFHHG